MQTVLRARKICKHCKIYGEKPTTTKIVNVPPRRFDGYSIPLTHVGLDFFGAIIVNMHKRNEKRWSMILMCLIIRAVHIEVVHNLSTDACFMCLRNLTSRRDMPNKFYRYNGTNFHSAEKELREALK